MNGKVEESREVPGASVRVAGVRQSRARVPQLVEERVNHRIDGGESLSRRVLKQARDQVNGIWIRLPKNLVVCKLLCQVVRDGLSSYLIERVRFDLRKLVLHVVRIHSPNLVARWRAEDLDDLHELIDT